MTDSKTTITYADLLNALERTQDQIKANDIRFTDVQRRLERSDISMSRRAELVAKEKTLDVERAKLGENLKVLIDTIEDINRKAQNQNATSQEVRTPTS